MERARNLAQAHREAGFSLIELMAALAIIAVAGLVVVNVLQATTRNTQAVEDRALAMLAAENLMNMQVLQRGRLDGDRGTYDLAGEEWDWELSVTPTSDADLLRLYLEVRRSGQERILAQLETYRRRP